MLIYRLHASTLTLSPDKYFGITMLSHESNLAPQNIVDDITVINVNYWSYFSIMVCCIDANNNIVVIFNFTCVKPSLRRERYCFIIKKICHWKSYTLRLILQLIHSDIHWNIHWFKISDTFVIWIYVWSNNCMYVSRIFLTVCVWMNFVKLSQQYANYYGHCPVSETKPLNWYHLVREIIWVAYHIVV